MIIWFGSVNEKLNETSCGKEQGGQIDGGARGGSKLDNQVRERRGNGGANGFFVKSMSMWLIGTKARRKVAVGYR